MRRGVVVRATLVGLIAGLAIAAGMLVTTGGSPGSGSVARAAEAGTVVARAPVARARVPTIVIPGTAGSTCFVGTSACSQTPGTVYVSGGHSGVAVASAVVSGAGLVARPRAGLVARPRAARTCPSGGLHPVTVNRVKGRPGRLSPVPAKGTLRQRLHDLAKNLAAGMKHGHP